VARGSSQGKIFVTEYIFHINGVGGVGRRIVPEADIALVGNQRGVTEHVKRPAAVRREVKPIKGQGLPVSGNDRERSIIIGKADAGGYRWRNGAAACDSYGFAVEIKGAYERIVVAMQGDDVATGPGDAFGSQFFQIGVGFSPGPTS